MSELVEPEPDETAALGELPVLVLRGEPVMLAADVARAVGMETRAVVQAVKRNPAKFPATHAFELTANEVVQLTSQGVIPKPGRGGSRARPWAFTHKGAIRLVTIVNTPAALDATDRIIDLFIEVQGQISLGLTRVSVSNPSRLLPDSGAAASFKALQAKIVDALNGLLDTVVDTKRHLTIRDELAQTGTDALGFVQQHLRTKGLLDEKVSAEILLTLERIREIRERTAADVAKSNAETETIVLGNIDRKIAMVDKLWRMAPQFEPNAVVELFSGFGTPGKARAKGMRLLAGE